MNDPLSARKKMLREHVRSMLAVGQEDPALPIPGFKAVGKAAERLRALPLYQAADTVFAAPDQVLAQVRLNILTDGKKLITATPGLSHGFVQFDPRHLTFKQRLTAIRSSTLYRGRPLPPEALPGLNLEVLVTGSVAVDAKGRRLGDGTGLFDAEFTLFSLTGSLHANVRVITLIHPSQLVDEVPAEQGDVPVDFIVTPDGILACRRLDTTGSPTMFDARSRPLPRCLGRYTGGIARST
ncbi:hypothetical protein JW905_06570 [bacterium]|nr:hypothetical protein [candidate division CSSED10-310 bacterium]